MRTNIKNTYSTYLSCKCSFSEIFFLVYFYGHANLNFMLMLFVHVLAIEKHTFENYKKLLEEIEIS